MLPAGEAGLLAAAQGGDAGAFERLVAGYRRELTAHCYRMLGSPQDAEDALQESLLAAWRGLGGFQARSSFRGWLYRIATNACLRLSAKRPPRLRSPDRAPARTDTAELGAPVPGPVWLEPWPEQQEPASPEAGPGETVLERERVELAFVAAFQHLPSTQRAVLLLREVLELSATETAEALATSVPAVNSALQRARAAVEERVPPVSQAGRARRAGLRAGARARGGARPRLGAGRRRGDRRAAHRGRALHDAAAAGLVRQAGRGRPLPRRTRLRAGLAPASRPRERAARVRPLPAGRAGRPVPARRAQRDHPARRPHRRDRELPRARRAGPAQLSDER